MNTEINETIENQDNTENEFVETMQIHSRLSESTNNEHFYSEKEEKKKKIDFKNHRKFHYLDKSKSDILLKSVKNTKHKTIILIMMDCGLRVTECVTLQLKNFNFKKKTIIVKSLKKRGEEIMREIPLSTRLIESLADYIKQRKPQSENDFLFPGMEPDGHLSRKSVNRLCERLKKKNPAFKDLHPHALRHTFATTMLASGAQLHQVKEMLGHSSYDTTLIYNHTPIELLRKHVENATEKKQSWLKRFFIRLLKIQKKIPSLIQFSDNPDNFIIGREKETILVFYSGSCSALFSGETIESIVAAF